MAIRIVGPYSPESDSPSYQEPKKTNLSSAFSFGANVLDNATGLISNIITNRQNAKNQQKQNEFNLKMWHLNNQYNTPSAQMQRLQQAGLNPNLMYQNGTTGISQGATSSASGSAMQAFQPDFSSGVDSILSYQLQKQLTDAQVANIDAQTEKTKVGTQLDEKELSYKDQEKNALINQMNANIRKIDQEINNLISQDVLIKAQAVKTENEAKLLMQQFDFNEKSFDDRLEQIRLQNDLTKEQIKQVKNATLLLYYQAIAQKTQNKYIDAECQARIRNLNADADAKELATQISRGKNGMALDQNWRRQNYDKLNLFGKVSYCIYDALQGITDFLPFLKGK
jgi:hypothetical protein